MFYLFFRRSYYNDLAFFSLFYLRSYLTICGILYLINIIYKRIQFQLYA